MGFVGATRRVAPTENLAELRNFYKNKACCVSLRA